MEPHRTKRSRASTFLRDHLIPAASDTETGRLARAGLIPSVRGSGVLAYGLGCSPAYLRTDRLQQNSSKRSRLGLGFAACPDLSGSRNANPAALTAEQPVVPRSGDGRDHRRQTPKAQPPEGLGRFDLLPNGGANRDRTGDLLLAKQALSQLSYGPWSPILGRLWSLRSVRAEPMETLWKRRAYRRVRIMLALQPRTTTWCIGSAD